MYLRTRYFCLLHQRAIDHLGEGTIHLLFRPILVQFFATAVMASENGTVEQNQARPEEEPLLGRPGDATQHQHGIQYNFFIGTAILAQAGIWILAALVWASVFMAEGGVIFFSYHPVSTLALEYGNQEVLQTPCLLNMLSMKMGRHPLHILRTVLGTSKHCTNMHVCTRSFH